MHYWRVLVIGAGALLAACAAPGDGGSSGPGSQPSASGQHADSIRATQTALSQQGYDPGAIDGKYGAKTATAIRRYQQDHSLPVDGQLSPGLLASLQGKAQSGGAPAPSSSGPPSQGSGLADRVNQGMQKLDQEMQKLGQGLREKFDTGVQKADQGVQKADQNVQKKLDQGVQKVDQGSQKVDQGVQKLDQDAQTKLDQGLRKVGLSAPGEQAQPSSASPSPGNAGQTPAAAGGANASPCPRDLHGRGVGVDCSVQKHWNQEHPGATPPGITQSAAGPAAGQTSTGGSRTISTDSDLAAYAARQHPGEKWGYLNLGAFDGPGTGILKDQSCCTLKVSNSVADGAQIEVRVSSGSFAPQKDFVQAVRGYVRRGQGKEGTDVFEATALYHQGNPHLQEEWERTAGWLSIHETVPLIH